MLRRRLAALLLVLLVLQPLAACAGTRSVTVNGWGALSGDDVDDARARAIADALERAVQRAGRTAVASHTRVENDWDVTSTVAADTFGVLHGYRIVQEGRDPARGYRVRLVAQVTTRPDGAPESITRVVVVAREQYRGKHTPPQVLGTQIARALAKKGLVAAREPWGPELVRMEKGELKVSSERARDLGEQHQATLVLVAWAEARHSDSANANLHSARAAGRVQVYAAASGQLVASKALAEVLGWGPTPERAGEAALGELRGPLALQAAVLAVGAAGAR